MAATLYVLYFRVSTGKQAKSGLGLEAQEETVTQYLRGRDAKVIARFVEVETGKDNEREELAQAIQRCRLTGAKLLIAKLDRLARRVSFIANLMDSDVEFEVANLPGMTRLTCHIYAAVAEEEARLISERTKDALARARANGVKLGNPQGFGGKTYREGGKANADKADAFAQSLASTLLPMRAAGMSLRQMAATLTEMGIRTQRRGAWVAGTVKAVLEPPARLIATPRETPHWPCRRERRARAYLFSHRPTTALRALLTIAIMIPRR